MMKISLIFILFFLFASCGSTEKTEVTNETRSEVEEEIASLKNEDFKPLTQVRYNEAADYHVIGDLVDDALKDETLAKVEVDSVKKTSDQMSGIASLCHLGNTKDGLKILDELYPKYKSNPTYWNQIGGCYFKNGDYRKAMIFYNKAISLEGNYLPAINNVGVIYLREGRIHRAVAAFKRVLEINKQSKTAKYNLANIYIKYGLFENAKSMLNELLRTDEKDKDVLLSLAYIELYKGEANLALSYLARVPTNFLSRVDFSLALLFSYKLAKNEKADTVIKMLNERKLSQDEKRAMDAILRMNI